MKAQVWLEKNYSVKEETYEIYINQQLEGILNCSGYKNLRKIFIPSSVIDKSKFKIIKGSYDEGKTKIIFCTLAQTFLDQIYSKKTRGETKKIDIDGVGNIFLEGTLDLSDFKNLEELYCSNNCLTNLNLTNCSNLREIKCYNNQLTTLNLSNLVQLETIKCSNNCLTQIIYPSHPKKITHLDITNNNLFSQDLAIFSKFRNLKELYIGNEDKNKINRGVYNRFQGSLEPLRGLNKLERLSIKNTDIDSGWEYLPNRLWEISYDSELRPDGKLAQIRAELEIEIWADIHKGFTLLGKYKQEWLDAGFNKEQTKEFLKEWNKGIELVRPKDGSFINWFLNFKKLDLDWACENEEEFKDWRDNYRHFGTCKECRQPNTNRDWCQPCNAQHFQNNFKREQKKWYHLTNKNEWTSGNEKLDKFIQKHQLEATSAWSVLEWIPYEQFTNVEYIADGGFGKVEKAEWVEGAIKKWDNKKGEWSRTKDGVFVHGFNKFIFKNYKTVALKTLSNSQNLDQNFLSELTLYKIFKSEVSQMVPCYGISRDTEGNYIMVMEYMPEGNLREYLRKNYRKLEFCNESFGNGKLIFLRQIIQGLKDIHRKGLVHRDFHSGNIIVDKKSCASFDQYTCHITDLGLSKPADENDDSQVYGIMPYMAPEVLKGEKYTQAADIYSLGMIMYEVITCLPPYTEYDHDVNLALMIIQGIRPQFPDQAKYPQLLVDLTKQCWDSEPNNRPTAREINEIVRGWFEEDSNRIKKDIEFYHQYIETEEYNETLYPNYQVKEAVWHSKPIHTKQITELLTSRGITLDLGNLSIQDPQEESSTQAQMEIPPKQ